jgi:hypothetical protein
MGDSGFTPYPSIFTSVSELETALMDFIKVYNRGLAKPFKTQNFSHAHHPMWRSIVGNQVKISPLNINTENGVRETL